MSDKSLRLIIAVATFAVGVIVVTIWLIAQRSYTMPVIVLADEVTAAHELVRQGVKFTNPQPINLVDGEEYIYSLPNGEVVSVVYNSYDSSERAKYELKKRTAKALKVLEQTPKLNDEGLQIGERVVAVIPHYDGSSRVSLLWTKGEDLISVEAQPLRYALAFEMQRDE